VRPQTRCRYNRTQARTGFVEAEKPLAHAATSPAQRYCNVACTQLAGGNNSTDLWIYTASTRQGYVAYVVADRRQGVVLHPHTGQKFEVFMGPKIHIGIFQVRKWLQSWRRRLGNPKHQDSKRCTLEDRCYGFMTNFRKDRSFGRIQIKGKKIHLFRNLEYHVFTDDKFITRQSEK
jgi:hypothetical protein